MRIVKSELVCRDKRIPRSRVFKLDACAFIMADEDVCHYLEKRFGVAWLRQECDETCIEGPALKPEVGAICGYRYNWNPPGAAISVDRPSRFITIHAGHVEVH